MPDFSTTTVQIIQYPSLKKQVIIDSGQDLSSDSDISSFFKNTAPLGKKVALRVTLEVTEIK